MKDKIAQLDIQMSESKSRLELINFDLYIIDCRVNLLLKELGQPHSPYSPLFDKPKTNG